MLIRPSGLLLVAIALCGPGMPRTAAAQERDAALFRVQIWGDVSAEFGERIRAYEALRAELERGLPPREVTTDVGAILDRTRALAKRIREARSRAQAGDIFTTDAQGAFRKALLAELDAAACAAAMDENPGSLALPINGGYPTHKPLSTVPPNVLATLPRLPEDVEYRFAGDQLFLFDTRAAVVIDRMPSAVACRTKNKT